MTPEATRSFLRSLFDAAVAAKASAAMAQVIEKSWNSLLSGLIVTRYGHDFRAVYIG